MMIASSTSVELERSVVSSLTRRSWRSGWSMSFFFFFGSNYSNDQQQT